MVVYFSATGNSRCCARHLAAALGDECVDAGRFIKDGIAAELISGKPWVFVAPVYAWNIPHVFESFLRFGWFQGCQDAYFVLTCGAEIGAAGQAMEKLCAEKSLHYRGTLKVVMPDNYLMLYPVSTPEESVPILEKARKVLDRAAVFIAAGKPLPPVPCHGDDRAKTTVGNRLFYRFMVKDKPFYATDACISCGHCAEVCVLNNIALGPAGKPVWGGSCTHCTACINTCPTQAIEYGKATKNRRRYRCAPRPEEE